MRAAFFKPANELFGQLLQQAVERVEAAYIPKAGEESKGVESLQLAGMFGSFPISRRYYYHPGKKTGHYPADDALGLEGAYTPALARLICLEGSDESSFQKASSHLWEVGGIAVGERQVQRVINRTGPSAVEWQQRESLPQPCDAKVLYVSADATGVPMRPAEVAGRPGKVPGSEAKTRMVHLGCVFTQHTEDESGRPLRDHESTTYLSGFQSPSDFGIALRREAIRRGLYTAANVVLLIDGASGLEKLGRDYFPDAVQIVDFFHALEHLNALIEILLRGASPKAIERRRRHWKKLLARDGVERIIKRARREAVQIGKVEEVEKALGYFANNIGRMQYGTFRSKHFFIGSGVVEAGCRSVIGQRCKQSGMFWSLEGAENILAFRCIQSSRRLNDFWKHRRNCLAAKNDSLPLAA